MTKLDKLTYLMRDATPEEYESVNEYISSISVDTGVNFYQTEDELECLFEDRSVVKANSSL